MRLLKAIWARRKIVAHKIGNFQARLLLALFYFIVLAPFAVGVKLLSDPLRLRTGRGHGWLLLPPGDVDPVTLARRQF
jgi:hypothetical protein